MKLYKITAISAVLAFISGIAALICNPYQKRNEPLLELTPAGSISLIVLAITTAIFFILLGISYAHKKFMYRKKTDTDRSKNFQLFTSAGRYDEKYDSAELEKKKKAEKNKLE